MTQTLQSAVTTKNITFSIDPTLFSGNQTYIVKIIAKENTPLPGIEIYDSREFSFQVVTEPSALFASAIYVPKANECQIIFSICCLPQVIPSLLL